MARSGKNISFGADSAHTVSEEEKAGFVDYINTLLREDAELQEQHLVPLEPNSDQIFSAVESGLLLAKLVNAVAPNAVDMKKINKKSTLSTFNKTANLNVVLAAAKEIGVQVTNVGAEDIMEGRPHLVLGIIWQVLRVGLETQMRRNIEALGLSGFKNLRSAQEILLKWVNDSIAAQGCKRTARNLSSDISDSEVYAFLLKSIDPSVDTAAILAAADHGARADAVLKAAERLGLKRFVQPADIVSGSQRLNFAFVANLFNNAKHAKPAAAESPAQPNREAELLAIIERLQIENEALKRDNERLRQGSEEGSKLKKRVVELESNAQSANLAAELDQLKLQLAEAEQARAKLAEQSAASASAGQLAQELQSKLAAQEEANRQLHQELQAKESSLQKLKAEEEAELAKLKSELNAQEDKLKAQMKEKEEEMERLRAQMNKTEAASAEQRNLEEQLRSAELALQDYEDRLKAIAAEDFVQKKALEEKQDNLMNLPLSAIRNGKERFSGWLHKAGNRNKAQWKKRYCVLRDNYLFYYHTDNDKKEKQGKWVRLNGAKVESLGDREKDKKRHLFVIHPQQEAAQGEKAEKEPKEKADKAKPKAPQYYEFFGADEAEMNQWVNALNAQIAALGPTTNEQMLRQSLYRRQTIAKDKSPVADAPAPEGAAKLEPINADAPREVPAAAAPAAAAPAAPAAEAPLSPATAEKKKDVGVLSKITSKFFSDDKKEKKESHKDEKEKEKEAHPAATDEKKAEGDAASKDAEPKKDADAKEHKEGEAKKDKKEKKEKKHKEKKDDSSKSDSKEEKKEKEAHKEGEAKKDDKHEKKDGGVMGKITAIFTGDEKKDKDAHKEAHPAASPSTEEAKEKEPKEEKKDEHKEKEHKEKEHKEKEHKEKEHKEEKKDGGVMGKITAIFTSDEKKDKDAHKESPHPAAVPAAGEEHKEEKKESSSGSAEASKEQAPASPKSEPREAHGKDDKEHEERKRKEKEEKEAKKAAEKEREAKEKAEKKAKKEQEKREHDAKKEAERKEHEERKAKEKEEKEAKKAAEAREREEKKAAEKARKSDGKGDAAAPVGSPALPKEEEAKKEEAKPADEAPKAAEESKAAEAPKSEEAKKDDGAKAELAV